MNEQKQNTEPASGLYLKIEELLGLDLRALGVFRILIAGLVLIDLMNRSFDLVAHYTDAGVVPRSLVFEHAEQPWLLSFHMLSGGPGLQVVLFVLAGAAAIALLVGYRSRLACFFCWLLMLSLHVRNPFVNNLGDWLLVDLLFWGVFLPLGARYAWESTSRAITKPLPVRVISLATLGVLLQIGLVYVLAGHHKISPAWHTDGTAVALSLQLDRIASPLGQQLLLLPDGILRLLTFATLYLEKWAPLLLLVPVFVGPVRTVLAVTFMVFHLGLALSFELGVFPFICIAAWVLVLPASFWDRVGSLPFARLYYQKISASLKRGGEAAGKSVRLVPGILETLIAFVALFGSVSSAMLYAGIMDESYYDTLYRHVEPAVNTINMRQRWDMFSPGPPRRDGWFVVAGSTKTGTRVDLLQDRELLDWSRPAKIAETYKNQRWRKYMEWVMNKGAIHGPYMLSYYEAQGGRDGLDGVALYFLQERTLDDGSSSSVRRQKLE